MFDISCFLNYIDGYEQPTPMRRLRARDVSRDDELVVLAMRRRNLSSLLPSSATVVQ
jgi:hypothetical protein